MTKLVHWTLTSQSTKQVICFELVIKCDHFNRSILAKGKTAPAVLLLMRQNKHYAAKQTLPNLLANLIPREICYEEHSASGEGVQMAIAFGGKTSSLQCSADVDRKKCNKRGRGADSGQKLLMQFRQRTQIFCPCHLYSAYQIR